MLFSQTVELQARHASRCELWG
eukprot:COSAG06_NODE_38550_length_422_cov_0.863777_1_plen_21_part_10